MKADVDLEALLVALVLAPATYARNRFFQLFTDPAAHRARRRASLVRSILRHAGTPAGLEALTITPLADGGAEVSYLVRSLGLKRTTTLAHLELSLVRFGIARRSGGELAEADPDRVTIESALHRLGGAVNTGFDREVIHRAPDVSRHASTAPTSTDRS